MATPIQIDTAAVRKTAAEMNRINQSIFNEFKEIEAQIKSLSSAWDSTASDVVIHKFYEIKNNFYEPRKKELDNFVQLLNIQISDGYDTTEKANKDLSKLFF